jgi:hypothetical protein
MADDYLKTAQEMLADARHLHDADRYRNACYLAGYVVECTAKMLLVVAGNPPRFTHDLEVLHDHIDRLRLAANTLVARYGDPTLLAPKMREIVGSERVRGAMRDLLHWDPYFRYDGSRWNDYEISRQYIHEAEQASAVLDEMILDGVI